MTLPYLYLRDAFQFPPYFKTFLLLGMFCVNKVSQKFSTTGGKSRRPTLLFDYRPKYLECTSKCFAKEMKRTYIDR